MEMTDARWAELEAVQAEVNSRVHYRTDMDLYRQADFWTVATTEGDCEDYALAKRQDLMAKGWPVEALRLATCLTEAGEGHAVLTVDTDHGTYVLDNRWPHVKPWADLTGLGYRWLERQVPGQMAWAQIPAMGGVT